MFVGVVTDEVPIGSVVLHTRFVLQELAPCAIVQFEALSVPDGAAHFVPFQDVPAVQEDVAEA
jgi:hypothetical protein